MGYSFSGLFLRFGELSILRTLIGISNYLAGSVPPQAFKIAMMSRVRARYGLESQAEAQALIWDIGQNMNAARMINEGDGNQIIGNQDIPYSSNIMGGADAGSRYVYSGVATLVDEFGDEVRKIPFVIEGDTAIGRQDLLNKVAEDVNQFIEKYLEELRDQGVNEITVGSLFFQYAGRRV